MILRNTAVQGRWGCYCRPSDAGVIRFVKSQLYQVTEVDANALTTALLVLATANCRSRADSGEKGGIHQSCRRSAGGIDREGFANLCAPNARTTKSGIEAICCTNCDVTKPLPQSPLIRTNRVHWRFITH